jgi:predicted SAM-dependent methyltransferase
MHNVRVYLASSSIGPVYMSVKILCLRLRYVFHHDGIVKTYLKSNNVLKLQVGSGGNVLIGWLNTDLKTTKDVLFLDATKHFPFHNDTFNYIFTEHFIEHLEYQKSMSFMRECYRVLKPSGKLRVATPNLRRVIELYGDVKSETQKRYIETVTHTLGIPAHDVFVINHWFAGCNHKFVYDYETLKTLMMQCGFVNVEPFEVGISKDPNLKGLEMHGCEEVKRFESMVVEGTKPVMTTADSS